MVTKEEEKEMLRDELLVSVIWRIRLTERTRGLNAELNDTRKMFTFQNGNKGMIQP